jgi:hypothetical protein
VEVPSQVRIVLATVFVGALAATLVAGLIWAYTPVRGGGLEFLPDSAPQDEGAGSRAAESTAEAPGEPATPTGSTPTPTPTEDPDERFVAEAAEPADTSVQVLDAGAGASATQSAAEALRGLGYRVTNVTSARARPERTTVWYTSGSEVEARALRARDGRFADVGPNAGLNEVTDLHVLVAPDWETAP